MTCRLPSSKEEIAATDLIFNFIPFYTILLYFSLELLVQTYCTSRLIVFLVSVLVSLHGDYIGNPFNTTWSFCPCSQCSYLNDVCVCVFSSHSFWTSSSLDVPAGVTQEGHTGFFTHLLSAVRALIFLGRRIQPFLSLVDREVEFCVLTI